MDINQDKQNMNIKIKKISIFTVTIAITGLLSACSKSESPQQSATIFSKVVEPKAILNINNSSPDNAIKSWWAYLDFQEKEAQEDCMRPETATMFKHPEYLPKVAQEELLKATSPKVIPCELNTYARDIQEVKIESETRAIVFANIKNSTTIPVGAVLNDIEKKWRENGFKYKYLVEKSSLGWKVSQVYKFDEYKQKDDSSAWAKLYVYSEMRRAPAYVGQQ